MQNYPFIRLFNRPLTRKGQPWKIPGPLTEPCSPIPSLEIKWRDIFFTGKDPVPATVFVWSTAWMGVRVNNTGGKGGGRGGGRLAIALGHLTVLIPNSGLSSCNQRQSRWGGSMFKKMVYFLFWFESYTTLCSGYHVVLGMGLWPPICKTIIQLSLGQTC